MILALVWNPGWYQSFPYSNLCSGSSALMTLHRKHKEVGSFPVRAVLWSVMSNSPIIIRRRPLLKTSEQAVGRRTGKVSQSAAQHLMSLIHHCYSSMSLLSFSKRQRLCLLLFPSRGQQMKGGFLAQLCTFIWLARQVPPPLAVHYWSRQSVNLGPIAWKWNALRAKLDLLPTFCQWKREG